MSSFSAKEASRRGSIVPPLAGVDRPQLETVPNQCDVLICGTGLTESILAAALAWQGTNVLHIDANGVYGDANVCVNSKDLKQWVESVANGTEHTGMNAQLYASAVTEASTRAKRFLFDLSPHLMFVKSDMLDLLIKSRVAQYLEFKGLSQFHTYESDSFGKVSGNKQDIFQDQSLSIKTKRKLMKFIKYVLEWQIDEKTFAELKQQTILKFMTEQFELELPQITELVIAIGLCDNLEVSASNALTRIRRYLLSLDVYGSFPVMYSMYGSAGELAQGFCRSAAVGGATYKLGVQLVAWDENSNIATLSDGSRVQVAEKAFLSPTQPSKLRPMYNIDDPHLTSDGERVSITSRMVAVVSNECREWFSPGESAATVVFPPGSLGTKNEYAVQTIVYGPGAGYVPEGFGVWYLSTHNPDQQKAREDLNDALSRLESSILRESQPHFQLGSLARSDIAYRSNGVPVVSSVKLGHAMQDFVPNKRLNYLYKLAYTTPTSRGRNFSNVDLKPVLPGSHSLLSTLFTPGEISYDGIVSQAKKLYEAVVGSDDDFFDVDFEDEEEAEPVETPERIDQDHPADEVMHMEI